MFTFALADKFCCANVEVRGNSTTLPGYLRKLSGTYRVTSNSKKTSKWIFKHDEHRMYLVR